MLKKEKKNVCEWVHMHLQEVSHCSGLGEPETKRPTGFFVWYFFVITGVVTGPVDSVSTLESQQECARG